MSIHRSAALAALLAFAAFGMGASQDADEARTIEGVEISAPSLPGWTVSDAEGGVLEELSKKGYRVESPRSLQAS